ncbi:hypothetical protein MRX96_047236 [Rhipicephalus microplus]
MPAFPEKSVDCHPKLVFMVQVFNWHRCVPVRTVRALGLPCVLGDNPDPIVLGLRPAYYLTYHDNVVCTNVP